MADLTVNLVNSQQTLAIVYISLLPTLKICAGALRIAIQLSM